MRNLVLALAAVVVVVALFLYMQPSRGVGSTPPSFTLQTPQGEVVSLDELRGKVVVLDFWASWCGPCRAAMPAIDRIHEEFADQGVQVYGVNVWDSVDPVQFMYEMDVDYPCLLYGDAVADNYAVKGIPTLIVIGADGKIAFRESGWAPHLEGRIASVVEQELAAAR